ncbi:MAG: AAA family ATPase [Woronichinia naegeliana WA131]|jgi:predicted ATP-binding protein involved in virulence|uniref:AAA family ATPase n=1 Tax=Woronichinia naegeliana WA131 TaxID=2824559 RepID=A0A977L0C9_9CYAN|nr:MAG: AAA family ATPase [Woronichinia naegeliana WA131]
MRIKQISITKLFGIFDHVIPLNLDERITIIHGINGVGKTSILRLINGLFNGQYSELLIIPFQEIKIDFDFNTSICLKQNAKTFSNSITDELGFKSIIREVVYKIEENNENSEWLYLDNLIIQSDIKNSNYTLLKLDDLRKITENADSDFVGTLSLNKIQSLELIKLVELKEKELKKIGKSKLEIIQKSIFLYFIECQRLINNKSNTLTDNIVIHYAFDLTNKIQTQNTEYGKLSQSLDRTFPIRVIQKKASNDLTEKQLRQKLVYLETKRHQLINVGLLEKTEDSNFPITDNLDESTRKLLSLYVEDTEKKLNVFSDFAYRLEVFQRIINQRFTHKTLVIDQDKGFILKTSQDEVLSPTDLSSGEQHELVMLYELLFKVKPGSLIFIDEPEISLHVGWQVKFLEDLQEIVKLADIDILLATHSPDIINGRWDLTIELKGLSNERVHSTKS